MFIANRPACGTHSGRECWPGTPPDASVDQARHDGDEPQKAASPFRCANSLPHPPVAPPLNPQSAIRNPRSFRPPCIDFTRPCIDFSVVQAAFRDPCIVFSVVQSTFHNPCIAFRDTLHRLQGLTVVLPSALHRLSEPPHRVFEPLYRRFLTLASTSASP